MNQEKILKSALLVISFVSIVIGISVFVHGFVKTRILAAASAEEMSSETETAEAETEEEVTEENTEAREDSSADSNYVDINDISAQEGTDGVAEEADDGNLTEDERIAMEEEEKEREGAEEAAASAADESNVTDNPVYITGVFIAADIDIPRAFAPTLALKKDGTFDLTLNIDDNMKSYRGSYTTSKKKNEMDDVYVYLSLSNAGGGIPDSATVVFSDSPDYCEFLDEGFGLMGYSGAPYGFYRDERE